LLSGRDRGGGQGLARPAKGAERAAPTPCTIPVPRTVRSVCVAECSPYSRAMIAGARTFIRKRSICGSGEGETGSHPLPAPPAWLQCEVHGAISKQPQSREEASILARASIRSPLSFSLLSSNTGATLSLQRTGKSGARLRCVRYDDTTLTRDGRDGLNIKENAGARLARVKYGGP
jgi:hypothetical protein